MENQQNTPEIPQDDSWLDEILGEADPVKEIGPDDEAMSGLTRPEDAEVERIVQEVIADAELAPKEEGEAAADGDATRKFSPEDMPELVPDKKPEPETIAPAKKKRPVRKGRPKMKKGYGLFGIPHILATCIWLAIIVAIGVSAGRILWVYAADVLAFGKEDRQVTILITEEDTIEVIAEKLSNAGLIRYPWMFAKFADVTGKGEKIDPGEYKLSAMYDYNAMINAMTETAPTRTVIDLMFTEGMTCAQIFQKLENEGVCTVEALEDYIVSDSPLQNYWFLEGIQRNDKYCLEGFLFPNTYTFYTNDNPRRVLEKFLDGFDAAVNGNMKTLLEEMQATFAQRLAARGYDQDYIDEHKLTIREVVIIASYVEKETANYYEDAYNIASVIYNRLTNPGSFPFLNIDAGIMYALGNPNRELTSADLELDSPYNTYLYKGLTPGAIANPGADCLMAALTPTDTGYYYYAYDPRTEVHHFSKTLAEHEAFLRTLN